MLITKAVTFNGLLDRYSNALLSAGSRRDSQIDYAFEALASLEGVNILIEEFVYYCPLRFIISDI